MRGHIDVIRKIRYIEGNNAVRIGYRSGWKRLNSRNIGKYYFYLINGVK